MTHYFTFGNLIAHPERLQHWFDAAVDGTPGPIRLDQIRGGASNALFRVERGSEVYALRRPPSVSNDPSANNILREIRLLRALAHTDVPHSRLVAACEDCGVIGTPFEVIAWVDGFTPMGALPEPLRSDRTMRREFGLAMVDGLARISNVDWRGIGLEGFGKPEGFLERQVDRWLGQLGRYRSRDLEHLDAVATWLRAHTPGTPRIGLIHGDYSPANVLLSHGRPLRLAAIVDWESATIGDPLLDLGHLLSGWRDADSGPTWATFVDWDGFPSRQQAAERYAAATGLPIESLAYYMTLAVFKLAIIMEGAYYRHSTGRSHAHEHAAMTDAVPQMMHQAARTAGLA